MDKNEFMFGLESDEEKQSYLEEVEREARKVKERDDMMKEYFDKYFMSYFPQYLSKHGASQVLNLIGKEDIKEYMKGEYIPEINGLIKKMDDEQKKLSALVARSRHTQIFSNAILGIASADMEEISDSEFREKVRGFYEMAIDEDCEMSVKEEEEEFAAAEAEYENEMEEERLSIQSEADEVYRTSQF